MKKNRIIQLSIWITKSVIAIVALVSLLTVIFVIHWHMDAAFYKNLYLVNGFQAGLNSFNLRFSGNELTNIRLSELGSATIVWIFIRNAVILAFVLVILNMIIAVLKSISNLETFYDQNIRNFRKIANIGFVLTLIAFFNFGTVDGVTSWNFTIPFQPLLFSSSFLVLAEVFKEGKRLAEDSKSIV